MQSVLTGYFIDISGQKKEKGSKIIQWKNSGGSNQKWKHVPAGQGVWKISSIHAPGMYLSIKSNDVNDGAKL